MTTYTPPPQPRTVSRRSRPVPLVIGILLALVGFPLVLGGLGLGWAMATQRDDDGFFSTPTEQLTTETVALSSEVVNLGEAGPDDWWADRDLATVRLSARSADASAVFIAIAPTADVAGYGPARASIGARAGEGLSACASRRLPRWHGSQASGPRRRRRTRRRSRRRR